MGRCGVELAPLLDVLRRELLAQDILHAEETPVAMLAPGNKKTQRAYVWAYATPRTLPIQGVVYDFQPTPSGEVSREFLAGWQGSLICDDYAGYKAGFAQDIREVGCWAHARRKFHELLERNQSPIAERALASIGALHEIERVTAEMTPEHRHHVR